jgi:hypothetical protein
VLSFLLSACLVAFSIFIRIITPVASNFKGVVSNFQVGINASIVGVACGHGHEPASEYGFGGVGMPQIFTPTYNVRGFSP